MPPSLVTQSSLLDSAADFSTRDCAVVLTGKEAEVTFRVEAGVLRRIRSRADKQDLAEYFWQNILKRAVLDHVY